MAVTPDPKKCMQRANRYAVMAVIFLTALALFYSLGHSIVWILSGLVAGTSFLAVYNYVLHYMANRPFRFARRDSKGNKELQEYINFHLPIVISILLAGLLLALIVLFWQRRSS